MKKFLIVLILISSIVSFAQNSSLIGKIISDKNEPLEGVNILITGTQFGAASLSDGSFEIKNLPFDGFGKREPRSLFPESRTTPL